MYAGTSNQKPAWYQSRWFEEVLVIGAATVAAMLGAAAERHVSADSPVLRAGVRAFIGACASGGVVRATVYYFRGGR